MKYLNSNFVKMAQENPKFNAAIEVMKKEVNDFSENFKDCPTLNSEWGHSYFCDYDGGRLIFDLSKPHTHKCEVCGKEFNSELYDGVWVYFYRNEAIVTVWKAAGLYKVTKEQKYLDTIKKIVGFYADNYTKFAIHNKERNVFENYEEMKWGCGRIHPQGLNEAIIAIRLIQTLEIVKEDLEKEFLDDLYNKMFKEMYLLLKPQVNAIHNIRCWKNSAIGLIGLFYNDKEMIDFVFNGEYNIRKQINTGVTEDGFWYEGSIHYNFFTLEGVISLLLFCEIYNYDFGKEEKAKIENMFISAYNYAFDNHFFPNPNDGWPSINLKTYSYIYHTATRIFGQDSEVGNLLKNIENNKLPRTPLPLSKPIYVNSTAYEYMLFNSDLDLNDYKFVAPSTKNFPSSSYAMIRNENMNVFVKYGLNGPSHAHPDLINIEVMHKVDLISRDISNAGYRAILCDEWHRVTLAHNSIVRNGQNSTSSKPGNTLSYTETEISCEALNVYEGVDYQRDISLLENGFTDKYTVKANEEAVFDYVFHLESDIVLLEDFEYEMSDLGFKENGYQHVSNVKKIISKTPNVKIKGILNDKLVEIDVCKENKELYIINTLDNPVNKIRTTILLRAKGKNIEYNLQLNVKENFMKDIQHFFMNKEIEGKEVANGVFRKILSYNDNLMVCEVAFKTGAIGTMHQHPHEQCTYIISGKFEFTIGDEKKIVCAGDSMYKEPNILHGAVCLEEGVLLDIFTPKRNDFLK